MGEDGPVWEDTRSVAGGGGRHHFILEETPGLLVGLSMAEEMLSWTELIDRKMIGRIMLALVRMLLLLFDRLGSIAIAS